MSNKLALPAHIFHDPKLSLRDIRVIAAISQITGKAGFCQVSRDEIAEVAGVFSKYVSVSTARLFERGWIDKDTTQRPVIYFINWQNTVTETGEECYQTGNTNIQNSATESVALDNGDSGDSATNVVALSGDSATKSVALDNGDSGYSATNVVALSGDSATKSVALDNGDSGDSATNVVALKEGPNSIYINNILHTSDLIRSDSDAQVIQSMIDVLISFGMPVRFLKDKADRDLIFVWFRHGVTADDIRNACQRALDANGTIGPRYITSVLRSLKILKLGGEHATGDEVTAQSLGFATIASAYR